VDVAKVGGEFIATLEHEDGIDPRPLFMALKPVNTS
jgi:hypothetical protein